MRSCPIPEKLSKTNLDELIEKYPRPDNCPLLVASKCNIVVWHQLKLPTKAIGTALQKCQKLLVAAVCARIQATTKASDELKTLLTHSLVFALSPIRNLGKSDATSCDHILISDILRCVILQHQSARNCSATILGKKSTNSSKPVRLGLSWLLHARSVHAIIHIVHRFAFRSPHQPSSVATIVAA